MAKDLKAFLTKMKEDSAFAVEVEAKCKNVMETEKISDKREILVKVGKELGYEFTVGDIERSFAEDREMSDAELEKVAGGGFWEDLEEFMEMLAKIYPNIP